MGGVKDQIMGLFKTKDYSKPERVKTVYEGEKKQSEENIIKSIRNLFKLKKENEAIKDKIIGDIRTLLEQQEEKDYFKPIRVGNFWNNNYVEYESSGDRNKNLSVKKYLDKIKPCLRDIIINPQKSDAWKIQLTIAINFISSKDVDEERVMHLKSNNIEFMSYGNLYEVVNELFESLLSRYQIGLEASMRGSDFIFDSVQLLYYKCHKINFKRGGSYIDSPDWIKKKKTTINPKSEDDKCFQNAVTAVLNYGQIELHPERVSNIKPFINKYNWKGINYPSKIDEWKTFAKNNPAIALNILYIKEKEIYSAYILKHNSTREKPIILSAIPNEEKKDGIILQ